ncbi:hypothetical protein [Streptomyces sp. S4.7]|uniref:hypothetical protein n=1 Tax=Streptomyces sp. S4.7 TaxID=2705439 RepID=UPI0013DAB300|nr:hypothetical protein [Streptomyces sp. S4.7]
MADLEGEAGRVTSPGTSATGAATVPVRRAEPCGRGEPAARYGFSEIRQRTGRANGRRSARETGRATTLSPSSAASATAT